MNNNNKEMMYNIFTNFLFTNYNDHSVHKNQLLFTKL